MTERLHAGFGSGILISPVVMRCVVLDATDPERRATVLFVSP